jgi:glucose-1-phosphate thymidylyltransferase
MGVSDIAIVLGDIGAQRVTSYYGDGSKFGVKIIYIDQGAPKGIAHAIGLCEDFAGKNPFIVYLGDNLIKQDISGFVKDFEKSGYDAGFLLAKVNDPRSYGVAELDQHSRIVRVEEKPKKPRSNNVFVGVYLFTPHVFDIIRDLKPSNRNELEITDVIDRLVTGKGYRITHCFVDGWWDDTGTPEAILDANRYILDSELRSANLGVVDKTANIKGRVFIGQGTEVKKESVIRGPVCIGKSCEIGPGAYIGPYTSIGNRCVLRNTHIESSVVLDGTYIDSSMRILDSLIGENACIKGKNDLPNGHKLVLGENSCLSVPEKQ